MLPLLEKGYSMRIGREQQAGRLQGVQSKVARKKAVAQTRWKIRVCATDCLGKWPGNYFHFAVNPSAMAEGWIRRKPE
jgi:hypothetical protein